MKRIPEVGSRVRHVASGKTGVAVRPSYGPAPLHGSCVEWDDGSYSFERHAAIAQLDPRDNARRYWRRIIAGSTARVTGELLDAAVEIAVATEEAGEPCGAWHAVSQAAGNPDCPCARCSS